MKISAYILVVLLALSSCGQYNSQNDTVITENDFRIFGDEKSSLDSESNSNSLFTQANTKSIGTGPFSKTTLSSSQSFNWAKMTLKLPKVNSEKLIQDGKRFCEIKSINAKVRNILAPATKENPTPNPMSVEFSRQNPQLYTGFNDLDIGVVYNTAVFERNAENTACVRTPYAPNYDLEINKWVVFSHNSDGNQGIVEFSAQENDSIDLEFWIQKLKFQSPYNQKTVFAIKVSRGNAVALQARVFSGNFVFKEAIKRVFSMAQTAGFQRLYGDSSVNIVLDKIQIGILKPIYGVAQWNLLIRDLNNPQKNNYGTGIRPIPAGSLPKLATDPKSSDIAQVTDIQSSTSRNFSEDAGVTTTSADSRQISIKLLPEAAIDGLESPFKLISALNPDGTYPTKLYKVGNSGRAPLAYKIPEPKWLESDPTQQGIIPAGADKQVKFKIKAGADGCPKAPFKIARPFFRFFRLQDTKVQSTAENDPSMASNQTPFAVPKDAVFDGSSLDRTATFHTLVVCATAELKPDGFDTTAIIVKTDKPTNLTFKNSGRPVQGDLKDIFKYDGSEEKAFTPAELKMVKDLTDLDFELTVKALGNVGLSKIIATVDGKTAGKLPVRAVGTIVIQAVCKTPGTHKFELTLNAKNDPVVDERKRIVPVTLQCPTASIQTSPTPISLTGNVGSSTNTQNLTISNTGDLDSTLEYKQFFVSENILDSSLLNPSPVAGAALRPLAVVVPPSLENSLIRASGFNPSGTSEGSLKVVTAGIPVSS